MIETDPVFAKLSKPPMNTRHLPTMIPSILAERPHPCRWLSAIVMTLVFTIAISEALGEDGDAGPFKEFSGAYGGAVKLESLGVFVEGRADGFVSGRGSGGKLLLRSTISFSGQTRRTVRKLNFKRTSYQSTSQVLNGTMDHTARGRGRSSIKGNRVRYSENTLFTFTSTGLTQTFKIKGSVKFFRRFILVTEEWGTGNMGSFSYEYRIRPR